MEAASHSPATVAVTQTPQPRFAVLLLLAVLLNACGGGSDPVDLVVGDGQPYDDEPVVDGGYAGTVQDSGSVPVTQDAATDRHDARTMVVDASGSKVDGSVGTPDAAVVPWDAGSVPDAMVPDASSQPDASTSDAGVVVPVPSQSPTTPYLRRLCNTSTDCAGQPIWGWESNGFVLTSLPRVGHDHPGEQPICVVPGGLPHGRCSFFCRMNDPTGTLGTSFPDHRRWCEAPGGGSQCREIDTGSVCMLGGLQ